MFMNKTQNLEGLAKEFFDMDAHYALSKSRRHPSVIDYIYDSRNGVDLFDLEKTVESFLAAQVFIESLAKENKKILFYTGRIDSISTIEDSANSTSSPYMTRRWIGGVLTNFSNVKKRTALLEELRQQRDSNGWEKHTKKEAILVNRDLNRLEDKFGGIVDMKTLPDALFILDPSNEDIVLTEAAYMKIPVIALANADSDIGKIDYPIIANNKSRKSIGFFLDKIVGIYNSAK